MQRLRRKLSPYFPMTIWIFIPWKSRQNSVRLETWEEAWRLETLISSNGSVRRRSHVGNRNFFMHLDTSMLISLGDIRSPVRKRVMECLMAGEPLHVSAVAWAEYLCGPLKAGEEGRCLTILDRVEPVDASTAALAAHLFNSTGQRAGSMGDCMMAASAILANEPLATEHSADFEPFVPHGLILADS